MGERDYETKNSHVYHNMWAFSGTITEFVAGTMEPPSAISPSSYSSYIFDNLPSGRSAVFFRSHLSHGKRMSAKAERFLSISNEDVRKDRRSDARNKTHHNSPPPHTASKSSAIFPAICLACPLVGLAIGIFKGLHSEWYGIILIPLILTIYGAALGALLASILVIRKKSRSRLSIFALFFNGVPLVVLLYFLFSNI